MVALRCLCQWLFDFNQAFYWIFEPLVAILAEYPLVEPCSAGSFNVLLNVNPTPVLILHAMILRRP
jgi:hypothetical protein